MHFREQLTRFIDPYIQMRQFLAHMCISTCKTMSHSSWYHLFLKKMHFSFYYWKNGVFLVKNVPTTRTKTTSRTKTTTRTKTTAGLRELKQLRLVLPCICRRLLGRRLPGRHLLPQLLLHLLHTPPLMHLLTMQIMMLPLTKTLHPPRPLLQLLHGH